jgi:hypothetical protein
MSTEQELNENSVGGIAEVLIASCYYIKAQIFI